MMVGDKAASQRDETSYFRIGSRRGFYPSISQPARLRSATRDRSVKDRQRYEDRVPEHLTLTQCGHACAGRIDTMKARRRPAQKQTSSIVRNHPPFHSSIALLDPGLSVYCVWVVSPVNSLRTTPCAVAATVLVPCWMSIRLDEILAHISGGWQAATIFTSS